MVVQGSRKSAIQLMPNFLFSRSPIKCILWGGPVVIMVSTGFFEIYPDRNSNEGFTQPTRASGIKKFPLTYNISFSRAERLFLERIPLLRSLVFLFENRYANR